MPRLKELHISVCRSLHYMHSAGDGCRNATSLLLNVEIEVCEIILISSAPCA